MKKARVCGLLSFINLEISSQNQIVKQYKYTKKNLPKQVLIPDCNYLENYMRVKKLATRFYFFN
jgi:hypothetical protein